ncbi:MULTISPECIES: indole-3-glycerol phosphate synthase TrpC [Lacticaseibacillus]|uniref:Indole-3-glycerol phosphate synthase n=2 Tax=Lacticaseibacillus TaxID=2759736 RepID=A0AAN1C774_LACCA|nr:MULTISPECIES: indole-3-glycerol phosphate synthase TrpC [Lacticaseibacillus]ARY90775.1 indole-3-glycerol phosphate synthase [Lacticaseibacillus casei]KAB1970635.1 indole-3-glycerol phosphate synthase TrpC [Lacticaseibacillus casei]WLV81389.1 indole-3-glycerol phosphate synthase TrpC [Lacticaseibacillus sp. NCIMB 15473]WNX25350.1 indole-3-glycerol phosphate synthase TrpC [Lacticaseibacillus casei]WNX28120.1 indole-3-glycerol phosphate synthase TrpC [Lacticaseibacillus casei]
MILDDLVLATKRRLVRHQQQQSLADLKRIAENQPLTLKKDFLTILKQPGLHIIAEVKKASPSKGTIVNDFPYMTIAKAYDQAGADAISVLTEPDYFGGNLRYLNEISQAVSVPTLRKDFTIDPYMIYEAKANGASIILLIVAILTDQQLRDYRQLAESLGMQAIVEAYTADEVTRALRSEAKIIGINNRNLKNFQVDFANSLKLRAMVPDDIPVIAESGIKTQEDVNQLTAAGFDAVLIGETLMRSQQKQQLIAAFKEA